MRVKDEDSVKPDKLRLVLVDCLKTGGTLLLDLCDENDGADGDGDPTLLFPLCGPGHFPEEIFTDRSREATVGKRDMFLCLSLLKRRESDKMKI